MADFPALKPTSRRYTMGKFPVTTETGFGGGNVRFLHGATSSSHELVMEFTVLTETQAALLRDHYREQQGGYLSFALSPEVWNGHSSMTDLVPTTTKWVYTAPLEETHLPDSYFNITVSLGSVI